MIFLLLSAAGGCSTFRALFSTEPVREKRTGQERKSRNKRYSDSGLESRRYNRDPLDALVFRDRKKTPRWAEESLSESEKQALRNSLDPDSRKEIDRIYLENERSRKKRSEWVFGPNPFRK